MALILAVFIWVTMPMLYVTFSFNYSIVVFFCVGSILVFSVLLAGWSSNSKYSLIGSLRSVAQSISYESVFSTLIVLCMVLLISFSIRSSVVISSVAFALMLPVWLICTLAETHRAPFDFSESESELVSGFNTGYSGAYFAFIFLSEYTILLYSCILISHIFFYFLLPPTIFFIVVITLSLSFLFIWIRITFCRFRYDILMSFSWKVLLPSSLALFLFYFPILLCYSKFYDHVIPCLLWACFVNVFNFKRYSYFLFYFYCSISHFI